MNKKVRVLEVLYGFGYGGIRACIQNYIGNIDKESFQVDIYAYGVKDSPFKQQFEEMGCKVTLDSHNYIAEHKIIQFIWVLYKHIKEGKYEVVHAHCNLISAWVTLAARLAGAKIRISHSHSTSHLSGHFVQDCWCYLRRFIINYTATCKMACGRQAGLTMYGNNKDVVILPNAVDIEKFAHKDEEQIDVLRKEFGIPEGSKIYMNMTRLDNNKNHSFLLDIIREIHKSEPSSRYIIGGNYTTIDSSLDVVKKKIIDYGLQDVVLLSGPRMDMVNLYHLSDCWIFPSIKEGLPFGPIEMQAAGTPCLASDSITNEIDLGLGLISFMSLKEPSKSWAQKAMSIQKLDISYQRILEGFIQHGFDIKYNVKKLETIYKGN